MDIIAVMGVVAMVVIVLVSLMGAFAFFFGN